MELLWGLLWVLYWSICLLLNLIDLYYLVSLGAATTREDDIICFINAESIQYVHGNKNTGIPSIEIMLNIAQRNHYLEFQLHINDNDTWNDDTSYML